MDIRSKITSAPAAIVLLGHCSSLEELKEWVQSSQRLPATPELETIHRQILSLRNAMFRGGRPTYRKAVYEITSKMVISNRPVVKRASFTLTK